VKCKCGGYGRVTLSRIRDSNVVYRRRRCAKCGYAWSTIELSKDELKESFAGIVESVKTLKDKITKS